MKGRGSGSGAKSERHKGGNQVDRTTTGMQSPVVDAHGYAPGDGAVSYALVSTALGAAAVFAILSPVSAADTIGKAAAGLSISQYYRCQQPPHRGLLTVESSGAVTLIVTSGFDPRKGRSNDWSGRWRICGPVAAVNSIPRKTLNRQDAKAVKIPEFLLSKPRNSTAPCGASGLFIRRLLPAQPIWSSWRLGGSRISD